MAEYVYDIAQLIHQQQLAPLRIVAHSLGGIVALRYAGMFPEDVERLVVIEGSAAGIVARGPAAPARAHARVDRVGSRARRHAIPRRYASARRRVPADARGQPAPLGGAGPPPHDPRREPERGRHVQVEVRQLHPRQPGRSTSARTRRRELWRNIACPVLLVTGSESWARAGGPTSSWRRLRRRPARRGRRRRPLGAARPARRLRRHWCARFLAGLNALASTTRTDHPLLTPNVVGVRSCVGCGWRRPPRGRCGRARAAAGRR